MWFRRMLRVSFSLGFTKITWNLKKYMVMSFFFLNDFTNAIIRVHDADFVTDFNK